MSFLVDKIKSLSSNRTADLTKALKRDLSIADCESSCDSSACDGKGEMIWPQFKDLDLKSPLYNSSKPSNVQFLIPTSKDNWKHDAVNEEFFRNSVPRELDLLLKDYESAGKFGINVVNQSIGDNIFDSDVITYKKVEKLYVLPFFITLNNVLVGELEDLLDILIPVLANTSGFHTRKQLIDHLNKLFEKITCSASPLDLNNLLLLCSHKQRDKKCGITAPILKKEIFKQIDEFNEASKGNCVGKSDVWFTNHVGGHKFQANLQIYLNYKNDEAESYSTEDGNLFLWLARVAPKDCKEIVQHLLVKKGGQKSDVKLLLAEKVRCGKRFDW